MNIEIKQFEKPDLKIKVSHIKQNNPKGVLVVFPGAGYNYMGPCLYYPSNLFLDNKYDIVSFEYDFRENRLKDNLEETYSEYFDFLEGVLKQLELPNKKVALCKSIGTRIVASNDNNNIFSEIIWLTPAIKDEFVANEIMKKSNKSLVVIGTADPFFDQKVMSSFENSGVLCKIVEAADHGLDIDGDTLKSILEMSNIVSWIKQKSRVL